MEIRREDGDIMVIFAVFLLVIVMFLALTTDVVLAFSKKDRLMEIGEMMLDARIDISEELWHSHNPEADYREFLYDLGRKNGLEPSQIEVSWVDIHGYSRNQRMAEIELTLRDIYYPVFINLFWKEPVDIVVNMKTGQHKGSTIPLWHPY